MQERPPTKGTSIRITEQDDQDISQIIAAGWARNRSSAVSWALRVAAATLAERSSEPAAQ